jgi:hypothetical protein
MKKIDFDFLTNYQYYGRRRSLLKEDELDDALGLGDAPAQQPAAPAQDAAPAGNAADAPAADATPQPTQSDTQPVASEGEPKVEVDVSQLVTKQDQITQSVQSVLDKLEGLIKNNETLKSELNQKIDALQTKSESDANKMRQELQRRILTSVEKLQLQSLYSFPYNIKLTDYWKPTTQDEYKYAVANVKTNATDDPTFTVDTNKLPNVQKPEDNEYILKQSQIMQGYSENFVKNSF